MKPMRTAIVVTHLLDRCGGRDLPAADDGRRRRVLPAEGPGSLVEGRKGRRLDACSRRTSRATPTFIPGPPRSKYDASSSGASNEGYTSADLKKAYDQRKADWQKANGTSEPPMDMLFASGSGLDPHISPRAAELQVPRVAAARHLPADRTAQLLALVRQYRGGPQLGFLGEPRVNVLRLNLALDEAFPGAEMRKPRGARRSNGQPVAVPLCRSHCAAVLLPGEG